ncbi:regulator of Vps4 activity in the MVB pathway-domain-containing protein [Ganoderma leucocontextum]|nr:regulator of Vps4 activity in the MVB pathway-domain-containing protein [Ganoderma leucocontextum]
MAAQWDTGRVKAQMRLTAQRLGQLQDRMDSQAQITQRDIATLLQQGNVALARAKAQKLMRDDVKSDLMQTLEMHIGVILGHLNELERSSTPSPIVAEAASSIIYAGLQIESKDLHNVREFVMQALGPDFTRSAITNQDNYVSARVLRAVAVPPPTAARLDQYLYGIGRSYNVQWLPDLSPQQKVNALSPIVDPEIVNVVDLANLRQLCSHGLPSHPPWLRPRIWRLLLGTLPPDKATWRKESHTQRDNYYDLVRRLLEPLPSLPEPTVPLSSTDQSILDVFNELSMVPPGLLSSLEEEPEPCPQCPLDDDAPEDIKIATAGNLNDRLRVIRAKEAGESGEPPENNTPEIRLDTSPEIQLDETPEVRLEEPSPTKTRARESTPEDALSVPSSPGSEHSGVPTTLLPSRHYTSFGAHNKHSSALLRLLYLHSCLNPANRSPQIGSLLVPIYAALVEEVDPEDIPHVEADTFWVFESMVGEFAVLQDEQNGTVWVQKLSDRLRWADTELADDLATKGLDPGLLHYSFRWLVPLLTHTLPLPAVLMVWDAVFSCPMRERDENPKLDYLIDVCTSMLVSARGILLQLGRAHRKQHNLWTDEIAAIPSTAFGERELEEAFIEGMAFLQKYPLDAVGGIEKVLQTACDLASQREAAVSPQPNSVVGLGARLRDTVWKGISSSLESNPDDEDQTDEETDEEYEEKSGSQSQQNTFSARLAGTVWRGITNQSAMDVPSSPPSSPLPSPDLTSPQTAPPAPARQTVADAAARGKNMFWGYAGKLKDSDAAATFAKVSTNWRVKALDAWSKPRAEASPSNTLAPPAASPPAPTVTSMVDHARSISLTALTRSSPKPPEDKRVSVPIMDRSDNYSPPPRPAFFRPVRDSVFVASPISHSGDASPVSESGSLSGPSLLSSSFKHPSDKTPTRSSTGPRPLLLNSTSLLTGSRPDSPARSSMSPSVEAGWVESVRAKRPSVDHRASQSSISSLSPSEPYLPKKVGTQSDFESDSGTTSRVVPINRNKAPSPMARASRRISPPTPPKTHRRLPTNGSAPEDNAPGGWARAEAPDSPTTVGSPPPPGTPDAETTTISDVHVKQPESQRQRGSIVLPETSDIAIPSPAPEYKLARRQATVSRMSRDMQASDSSATEPAAKSPNVRRKRFPPRLQTLRNSRSPTEPSPSLLSHSHTLDVPVDDHDHENSTTPRANTFDEEMIMPPSPRSRRVRKVSGGEGEAPTRTRKISTEVRTRKISSEGRRKPVSAERDTKHKRESAAVEGDDEGYNDLLSAYESEDVS